MSGPVPGTPTPWQYRDDYTNEGFVTIIGNVDGEYVDGQAHCTYDVVCRCEDEFGERLPNVAANVRAIVHRMNNWDAEQAKLAALVEALEVAQGDLHMLKKAIEAGDPRNELLTRAADAERDLSKALAKGEAK